MNNKLAVDIGGTFTDVVLEANDRNYTKKLLTTHRDPSVAVLDGVRAILSMSGIEANEISMVIHGTTLATNALIERHGAKTALLTTAGHRDILAMAFENRFEQYDVNIERSSPLIPRRLRLPIEERMDVHGRVLRPLDLNSIHRAIERLEQEQVESVAIGFLHSYVNPKHELDTAEHVLKHLSNVDVCLSSTVCPEIREYERLSTTCANAYVLPLMRTYLIRMAERLKAVGFECPLMMMTSNGGLTTLEVATQYPIRLVESGPAGGAILVAYKARQLKESHVLSFDMGGTTAKICLIDHGAPTVSRAFEVDRRYRFKKGSGLPVRIPVIEMVEIGAGGGSIAALDRLNRLTVGPESAGSNPGPACYGNGGVEATVTDADVILGKLQPELFAEGELQLDVEAAGEAITQTFSDETTSARHRRALEINEVVDENMASAARSHANEWGSSLIDRTLIAYGGAAPLHATRLLEKLKLKRVIVPESAGVGSAVGFLKAPISYEIVRSRHVLISDYSHREVSELVAEMCQEVEEVVRLAAPHQELETKLTAYVRYVGQGYEIRVPFDMGSHDKVFLVNAFETEYQRLYGRLVPESDMEILSWTCAMVTVTGEEQASVSQFESDGLQDCSPSQELCELTGTVAAQVVLRRNLKCGDNLTGPAIVAERHTTTVVPSGYKVSVNSWNDLVLETL